MVPEGEESSVDAQRIVRGLTPNILRSKVRDRHLQLRTYKLLLLPVYGRWYAPSPRYLRLLLSAEGWFFVWSFVVLFLSCRVLFLLCVCV